MSLSDTMSMSFWVYSYPESQPYLIDNNNTYYYVTLRLRPRGSEGQSIRQQGVRRSATPLIDLSRHVLKRRKSVFRPNLALSEMPCSGALLTEHRIHNQTCPYKPNVICAVQPMSVSVSVNGE
jgi:hypothetical protein